jgi:hypothetical protein
MYDYNFQIRNFENALNSKVKEKRIQTKEKTRNKKDGEAIFFTSTSPSVCATYSMLFIFQHGFQFDAMFIFFSFLNALVLFNWSSQTPRRSSFTHLFPTRTFAMYVLLCYFLPCSYPALHGAVILVNGFQRQHGSETPSFHRAAISLSIWSHPIPAQ